MVWCVTIYDDQIVAKGGFFFLPLLFSFMLGKVHDYPLFFSFNFSPYFLIYHFVLIPFIEVFFFNLFLQLQFLIYLFSF